MNLDTSGGAALGLLAALHIAAKRREAIMSIEGTSAAGRDGLYNSHAKAETTRQLSEIELWNREVDARKAAKKRGGV